MSWCETFLQPVLFRGMPRRGAQGKGWDVNRIDLAPCWLPVAWGEGECSKAALLFHSRLILVVGRGCWGGRWVSVFSPTSGKRCLICKVCLKYMYLSNLIDLEERLIVFQWFMRYTFIEHLLYFRFCSGHWGFCEQERHSLCKDIKLLLMQVAS